MERCQVCGRHPAKFVTFKAHQGFVVFRREYVISGVFCRDHAIEAYLAARGATLKGMWFSTGSIVFGAIRSLWDSVKLLDLPGEVRDDPWVPHVVACPYCRLKNIAGAGPAECAGCRRTFTVASCSTCRAVHAVGFSGDLTSVRITCRLCGRTTEGPWALHNSPLLLAVRALAEIAALCRPVGEDGREVARHVLLALLQQHFELPERFLAYGRDCFDYCCGGRPSEVWRTFPENCAERFSRFLLAAGVTVARADGAIDSDELARLQKIAVALGFPPSAVFEEHGGGAPAGSTSDEPWWIVLGVSVTASSEEATFAYRRLAAKYHPDLCANASDAERKAAERRMKKINAAFEEAKRAIGARETSTGAKREAERPGTPAGQQRPDPTPSERGTSRVHRGGPQPRTPASERPNGTRGKPKAAPATGSSRPAPPRVKPVRETGDAGSPAIRRESGGHNRPYRWVPLAVIGPAAIFFIACVVFSVADRNRTMQTRVDRTSPRQSPVLPRGPREDAAIAKGPTNAEPMTEQPQIQVAEPPVVPAERPRVEAERPRVEAERPRVEAERPDPSQEAHRNREVPLPRHPPIAPSSQRARLPRPDIAEANRDYYARRAALKKAAELKAELDKQTDPSAEAFVALGISLYSSGKYQDALAAFGNALRIDPKCARAYHNRGVARIRVLQHQEAISDFSAAIKLNPAYAEAHGNRGLAYQMVGQRELASQDFQKARSLGMIVPDQYR